MGCTGCDGELEHCHGTLVLHADGSAECHDDGVDCGAGEAVHEWAVACTELGCGCIGDERPIEVWAEPEWDWSLAAAA